MFIRNQSLSRDRFYCNLILDRVDGGPNRFLKNLITSKLVKDKLLINNWSLKGCSSALVFSGSWGNSFSKVCKYRSIKTILRVDGFFVPDDSIDLDYQHSRKFQKRMNKRLALDLKQFDHIIYQSNFSKEICDKYLFNRKDDFSIISNGTDLDHFKPYGNNNNDRLKIILVAKYYPKHLDLALSIFKQIFKHINADMTIVGVMRDGTEGVKDYVEKSLILNLEKPNVSCKSFVKATHNFTKIPCNIRKLKGNTFILQYSCTRGEKLADFIYSQSNIFLERKYLAYKKFLEERKK